MRLDTMAVEGGFRNPVFDAQAVFRRVMDAFASPGMMTELGGRASVPAPLGPASAALLAALADGDTPIWMPDLDGAYASAAGWLRFQTGAPVVADPAVATFALVPARDDAATWARFPRGTPAYPDRSATVILPVEALEGGASLLLTGPGIASERTIAPRGLPDGFISVMGENRAGFPLGLDIVLTCGATALALPRTTRIQEA